jgi:hypothetical protein
MPQSDSCVLDSAAQGGAIQVVIDAANVGMHDSVKQVDAGVSARIRAVRYHRSPSHAQHLVTTRVDWKADARLRLVPCVCVRGQGGERDPVVP